MAEQSGGADTREPQIQRLKFQLPPVITRIYPEDGRPPSPPPSRAPAASLRNLQPPSPQRKTSSSTDLTDVSTSPQPLRRRSESAEITQTRGPAGAPTAVFVRPSSSSSSSASPSPPASPPPSPPPAVPNGPSGVPEVKLRPQPLIIEPWLDEEAPSTPLPPSGAPNGAYISKRRHTMTETASIAFDKLKAFFRRDSANQEVDGRHGSVVTIGSAAGAFSEAPGSRRASAISDGRAASRMTQNPEELEEVSCLSAWCSDFFFCGKQPPPNSPNALLEKHQCARFVTVVTILVILGVVLTLIVKAAIGE